MIYHLKTLKEKIVNIELSNTQKLILASLGVLLCILIILVIYRSRSYKVDTKDENLIYIYDLEKPIVIEKDDKYGYILENGETLLEPIYLKASAFWNGYAAVSDEEGTYKIIDKKGETVLNPSKKEPKYYSECGVWTFDDKIYDKNLEVVFEEKGSLEYVDKCQFTFLNNDKKESGIVNSQGTKVFTWDKDYITATISSMPDGIAEHYAIVNDYENVDKIVSLKTGKTIYEVDKPEEKYLRQEAGNIFRLINRKESFKTERWLYIKDDAIIFDIAEEVYMLELISYYEGILKIDYGQNYKDLEKDSRYLYYDIDTKEYSKENPIENSIPQEFKPFNYKLTREEGLFGLEKGSTSILEKKYDRIEFLNYELHRYLYENKDVEFVLLEKEEELFLYDIVKKQEVAKFSSTSFVNYKGSSFLTFTLYEDNGYTKKGYFIYNVLTNKSLEIDKNDEFEIGSNYVIVKNATGEKQIYNAKLKEIYKESLT